MEQTLREMGCGVYHIPVPRKVTALGAIFQSFRLSKQRMNEGAYDLIHCHSPIGGMICRLANRCSRHYAKTKMIYTAHGFHFYQGAPRKNWLLYYPMERFCGRFTDTLHYHQPGGPCPGGTEIPAEKGRKSCLCAGNRH